MEQQNYMIPIIQRLEDIGRAKEKLIELMGYEIFDNLSKHNPYFDSEHSIESDKLYDLRMKLAHIQDCLCNIYDILTVSN